MVWGVHVVEHDAGLGDQLHGLGDLFQAAAFDFDGRQGISDRRGKGPAQGGHGLGRAAGLVDVVVLEHEHFGQVLRR